MNMISLLFSLMESPIIRYSLYEQIYDKFYLPDYKFSISVSNYIANMNFGSLYYNLKNKLGFYINYLNSGKMERTDEAGNIIGEFYANFINFSIYKNFLKFNIHYESYDYNNNNLNFSMGGFFKKNYKDFNFLFLMDYFGLNTPLIFGLNTNYKNFNFSLSYEFEYKFIYNISYKLLFSKNLSLFISYTNRYKDFKDDILTGSIAGIEIKFKNYRIGYGIRMLSDYGFINTIQVVYE